MSVVTTLGRYSEKLKKAKDKKRKQKVTNNGTTYFYYEIVLRNEKLQSGSNQVQNFVSRTFTIK